MHVLFNDITDRLGEPVWYYHQKVCVPRYESFKPDMCGVYDDLAVLVRIRCQLCYKEFLVSVNSDKYSRYSYTKEGKYTERKIAPPTADEGFYLGDPPRHNCTGDTMCSDTLAIVEFWQKDEDRESKTWLEWVRHSEYEFNYEV